MVINILNSIKENTCGISCANNIRIMGIKDNIKNTKRIEMLFEAIQQLINIDDIENVTYIIQRLFYEELPTGLIDFLVDKYNATDNKEKLINDLRESYIKRGTKGILFAWMPILERD